MEGTITITVAQAHCDELGHRNHVEAVRYLERARSQWYRECGHFDTESEQSLGTVVVNIDYDYRVECFVGEALKVTIRPKSMGESELHPGACDHQCRWAHCHRRAVHQRHHGPRRMFDHPRPVPLGTFTETRLRSSGGGSLRLGASSRWACRKRTPGTRFRTADRIAGDTACRCRVQRGRDDDDVTSRIPGRWRKDP